MTKLIILVKICYQLLYICHSRTEGVDNNFGNVPNFLASVDISF